MNIKENSDVYTNLKYGDKFIIFIIKCLEYELNITEKNLIKKFNSYSNSYNKNPGIGGYY